jgi:hypothetical protein
MKDNKVDFLEIKNEVIESKTLIEGLSNRLYIGNDN